MVRKEYMSIFHLRVSQELRPDIVLMPHLFLAGNFGSFSVGTFFRKIGETFNISRIRLFELSSCLAKYLSMEERKVRGVQLVVSCRIILLKQQKI